MASHANGMKNGGRFPWRLVGWAIPCALLCVPLIAHFPWTLSDYVFAATMFGLVGGGLELAVRASGNRAYRAAAAVALGTSFLLVWINLAVGIIGNDDNPANLMFFAVIAVAFIGAIVARFDAAGMARAMMIAAAIQALIGAGVMIKGLGFMEPPGPLGLFVLIECFAGLWLLSAWLFRKAAQS
jgi:hypothetical protein